MINNTGTVTVVLRSTAGEEKRGLYSRREIAKNAIPARNLIQVLKGPFYDCYVVTDLPYYVLLF